MSDLPSRPLRFLGRIDFQPLPIACLQPGKRLPFGAVRRNKCSGRKPVSSISYPEGHVGSSIRSGFTKIRAYCLAWKRSGERCHHYGDVPLEVLPRERWDVIAPHFRCTECGAVGYVDLRVDWGEIVDFDKATN